MKKYQRLLTVVLFLCLLFALANLIQIPGWIFLVAAILALGRTQIRIVQKENY